MDLSFSLSRNANSCSKGEGVDAGRAPVRHAADPAANGGEDGPPLPSDWPYSDTRFSLFQDEADGVSTVFEVQPRQIDFGWTEQVRQTPEQILSALCEVTEETLVAGLLKHIAAVVKEARVYELFCRCFLYICLLKVVF